MIRSPSLLAGLALYVASLWLGFPAQDAGAQASQGRMALRPGTKVVVITGSTDGLGREVARRLADSGMHVVVHGRNRARGDSVVQEITKRGRGSARFYAADFASLAQVREFAATLIKDYPRIDVLVNNAGIALGNGPRQVSADGNELHFAVNYLAGYLLTEELLPLLRSSAPSRIVNVASRGQAPLDFDDIHMTRNYNGSRGYSQSKLAQIIYTVDLAERLAGSNVTVSALHPATMMNTTLVQNLGAQPRATIDEGATALVRLVTASDAGHGKYFNGMEEGRANAQAYDAEARKKLRAVSEELTRPKR